MAIVWIPSQLRDLTSGQETVRASGRTVGAVLDSLDQCYPGIKDRICAAGELRPGLTIAVDEDLAPLGLLQPVEEDSEIHILPAIGGGEEESVKAKAVAHRATALDGRRKRRC
ncbi:MAG: hypothetical protein KatS3mg105_3118 [Gemmatales bacterium]|nr:MAG: hypothetical protein KatS3mg105_3118 [Gemmatales bacterium]